MKIYLIIVCIILASVLCVYMFRGRGDTETDVRLVVADPEAYAGQTLTSRVKIVGSNHFCHTGGTASRGGNRKASYLGLKTSPDLANKTKGFQQAFGSGKPVLIKYQVFEYDVFAKIRACREFEERVRERSLRKINLEKERERLEKPVHQFKSLEKMELEAQTNLQRWSELREQLSEQTEQRRGIDNGMSQLTAEEIAELEKLDKEEQRLRFLASEKEQLQTFNVARARSLRVDANKINPQIGRTDAEKKKKEAEKKKLLAKARTAAGRSTRYATEVTQLQQLIKENRDSQQAIKQRVELRQKAKEDERRRQLSRERSELRELAGAKREVEKLGKKKSHLQGVVDSNSVRLAAIAEELMEIEEAEKTDRKPEIPLDSYGHEVEDSSYCGVLLDISIP